MGAFAQIKFTCSRAWESIEIALTRKGDPDNPLSDAELTEKFMEFGRAYFMARIPARSLWRCYRISVRRRSFTDKLLLPKLASRAC
jgi:hypothetical protein